MSDAINHNLSSDGGSVLDVSGQPQRLEEKIKELERQVEENFAGWQRARADYQNLKKEWERKQRQFMVEAKKMMLAELLPIYDHLKQAISDVHNDNHFIDWRRGIEQIKNQWENLLKRWGVEFVPTVGEKFDPEIHEAVEHKEASNEIISRELQGGYKVEGQLLYPAKVIVGSLTDKKPDAAEDQNQ